MASGLRGADVLRRGLMGGAAYDRGMSGLGDEEQPRPHGSGGEDRGTARHDRAGGLRGAAAAFGGKLVFAGRQRSVRRQQQRFLFRQREG
ncbi:hypothetical protein SDC9_156570 [bioreactor metagenome]|uniref:Uncharacterized protein n=1 Tax=bioreactor metagenome TaxID=1076179 RepID=A0A645F4T2_9ZZZZ